MNISSFLYISFQVHIPGGNICNEQEICICMQSRGDVSFTPKAKSIWNWQYSSTISSWLKQQQAVADISAIELGWPQLTLLQVRIPERYRLQRSPLYSVKSQKFTIKCSIREILIWQQPWWSGMHCIQSWLQGCGRHCVSHNAPVEYKKTLQLLFPPERGLLKMTHRYIN